MYNWDIDGCKIGRNTGWMYNYHCGNPVEPLYIEVSPTGDCNHRCQFCSMAALKYPRKDIDLDRWTSIVKSMKPMRAIMFGGEGEPCLHHNLAALVGRTWEAGHRVALTTNATLLHESSPEKLAACCDWIKASINAGKPETYARLHRARKGDWDRAWENMAAIARLRIPSLVVGAQMILLRENESEVEDHVQMSRVMGLDYDVIKPYCTPIGKSEGAQSPFRFPGNAKEVVAKYAHEKFRVVYRERAFGQHDRARPYGWCRSVGHAWAYIDSSLRVWGCSAHIGDDRFLLGDLTHQSWSSIWGGAKADALRRDMQTFDISGCRRLCRMDAVNEELARQWDPRDLWI